MACGAPRGRQVDGIAIARIAVVTLHERNAEHENSDDAGGISPVHRIVIALIVLVTGGAGFAVGRVTLRPTTEVIQPIAFNHQKHTNELDLGCDTCHEYLQVGRHGGLPTLETCLMCHEEPQGKNPEEARIRELAAQGKTAVFAKLFRLPEHAYYSHRRHAIVAAIPCATCHGPIAETTAPPTAPLVRVNMKFCISCHERSSVETGCTSCHH